MFVVIRFIEIVAPFKNIAVHIKQAKCVGIFQANLVSILYADVASIFIVPCAITKSLNSLRKLQSFQPPCRGTKSFGFHATTLQH